MDKMMLEELEELEKLYANKSRHSQYQMLASNIEPLVNYQKPEKSKYEMERFEYILKNISLQGKNILDIGGNTGYFTFEACLRQAKSVDYYEGNEEHARFVKMAAHVTALDNIINVHPEYFLFEKQSKKWDVGFCLNVVHHIGYDFDEDIAKTEVKQRMLEDINNMATCVKVLVFQMGYNWQGNINNCLFKNGLKREMEEYLAGGTKEYWNIEHIGIAVKENNRIEYEECTNKNNIRIDEYGEFLNRPLFIMKSKLI